MNYIYEVYMKISDKEIDQIHDTKLAEENC
jgi:hypothetical protein